MNGYKGALMVAAAAAFTFSIGVGVSQLARASATGRAHESGDVSSLPQRPDIEYTPLPADAVAIPAERAVTVAEEGLRLNDSQLDQNIGVVRALVSIKGSPQHQREKMWVVTFNDDIIGPGNGVLYHKLCAAVNAVTGDAAYAFAADPDYAHSPGQAPGKTVR